MLIHITAATSRPRRGVKPLTTDTLHLWCGPFDYLLTQSSQPAAIGHPLTCNAIISTSWNTLLLSRLVTQSVLNHLRCTPFPSHPPAAVCFQPSTIRVPSLPSPTPPVTVCFQPPTMRTPSPPDAVCFQPPTIRASSPPTSYGRFSTTCNARPHYQLRSVFSHLTPPLTSCGLFSTTCNRFLTTCDARLFY